MQCKQLASLAAIFTFICSLSYTRGILKFDKEKWITEKYLMRWAVVENELVIECSVQTAGYIGWGLSPQGAMIGADIVIMWIDDSGSHIQDSHGDEVNAKPLVDKSQDYVILQGSKNDTHTTVRFKRNLNTCNNNEDMRVVEGPMKLIYSYGSLSLNDPAIPLYHGPDSRGTTSMLLIGGFDTPGEYVLPDNAVSWDLLIPNITIPHHDHTIYWCKTFKVPELTTKHHIIMIEPIIKEGNERFVHHAIAYGCSLPDDYDLDADTEPAHLSDSGSMCDEVGSIRRHCREFVAAWAIGGKHVWYPEEAGYPIGTSSAIQMIFFEVHYDNPGYKEGVVDASGLRLWYTSDVRQHDAGTLAMGATVNPYHLIPPGETFTTYGYCTNLCTQTLPEAGIIAFAGIQHTHLLGRAAITRHYRGMKELKPIMSDKYYDFNYQDTRPLNPPVTLLPGDEFVVECHLDSTQKSAATFGGLTTADEMCLTFLLYYPATGLDACLSTPDINETNRVFQLKSKGMEVEDPRTGNKTSFKTYVNSMSRSQWSQETSDQLQRVVKSATLNTQTCGGSNFGEYKYKIEKIKSFPNYSPYDETDTCIDKKGDVIPFPPGNRLGNATAAAARVLPSVRPNRMIMIHISIFTLYLTSSI